jgi:PAS domain S-box-containing protein
VGASTISHDITDIKQMQERLRESFERYESLFNRILDGIYLSTHVGRFVDVNPAFVKMFGYSSKQEMLDIKDIKKELYFSPEERGSHILDTGQDEVEVYRMRRKDGSEIWVEDHGRYIHDADGKVIFHEGILRDVTERRRTEEALRNSEEKFRMIFQNSPLGIFRSTFDGHLLEVNPAMARMFGYDLPENMVREVHDIAKQLYVRVEDRKQTVTDQLRSKDVTQHLNHYRRRDGSEFIANLFLKTVRDREGRPTLLEGIVEDITERKQMEDRLSALHEHALKLASAKDLGEVAKFTLDAMEFTLGFNHADFWVAKDGSFHVEDFRGESFQITELRVNDRSVITKAATTKSTVRISDTRGEPAFLDDPVSRAGGEVHHMLSELAVPVLVSNEIAGILNVENAGINAFGERDQILLEMLGSHVASALDRLGQQDKVRRYSEHLEELVEERTRKLRESEEQTRAARKRLENIVTSNPAVIYSGKPRPDLSDFDLTYLSERVASLLGYQWREFLGNHELWQQLLHPEDKRSVLAQIPSLWEKGKLTVEYRMLHRDGGYRWIREESNATRDADGKPLEVIGFWTDITQRKQAELALAESEERYRRLFESSPVALWEEDFSEAKRYLDDLRSRGVKDLRRHLEAHPEDLDKCASMVKVHNVNESTLRLYGAKSVEQLTGELRRILPLNFHDRFREELIALSEGKTRFTSEFDNRTLTGETRHVNLILTVVPGYEDTLGKVLISTIDLTERRKMEQRLQQAERLAAVGETAAMVGHDLRNPLQGIMGAYSLLQEDSLTRKERQEILQLLRNSVEYAEGIVSDLLEFAGEMRLNLAETTPRLIAREAVEALKIPQNITLLDHSDPRPTLRVDRNKMRRVFVNLIENAIEAMPEGGTVTINSKQLKGAVEVSISDTATGMPTAVVENLWRPLQTTKAKGMGLGLAICKRIIEAHEGSISLQTKAAEGTTVTVRIPLRPMTGEVNGN